MSGLVWKCKLASGQVYASQSAAVQIEWAFLSTEIVALLDPPLATLRVFERIDREKIPRFSPSIPEQSLTLIFCDIVKSVLINIIYY